MPSACGDTSCHATLKKSFVATYVEIEVDFMLVVMHDEIHVGKQMRGVKDGAQGDLRKSVLANPIHGDPLHAAIVGRIRFVHRRVVHSTIHLEAVEKD